MSNYVMLGCQTVQEFLSNNNWEGRQIQPEASAPSTGSQKSPSWLTLTVEKFFSYHTWDGSSQESTLGVQAKPPRSILAVSVREFFATLPWQGEGVATITPQANPQTKKQEILQSSSQEFKLNDLSQLF